MWKRGAIEEKIKVDIDRRASGTPDTAEVRRIKGLIRETEATSGARYCGVKEEDIYFLNLPFYESGTEKKNELSSKDVDIITNLLEKVKPHQIYAAGGHIVNGSSNASVLFLVNNFSTKQQLEAVNQPLGGNIDEFNMFHNYLTSEKVLGFADVRYSNGADILFVEWMTYHAQVVGDLSMDNFGYAGWNTDGNTLGTVIGNTILLSLFSNNAKANQYFNSLRILEDCYYQAIMRTQLTNYVANVTGDNINNLADDLSFYEHFSWKRLNSDYSMINDIYKIDFQLDNVYYPWNRTFEIGFNEPDT